MSYLRRLGLLFIALPFLLSGCISPDNAVIEGTGTPDITQCSTIPGVADGKNFEPQKAVLHGLDLRRHPDLFYIAWANLDERNDLRSPAKGYSNGGFEDKLLVSRRNGDGKYETWQIWPPLGQDCKDREKVRIHSFDVAPNGKSLFISMSRDEKDNPDRRLAIYRLDIVEQTLTKISKGFDVNFLNPTYIGNDVSTHHEILLVAKTVEDTDFPVNYKPGPLLDEYDRDPTPIIYRMDATTGDLFRIGLNNSHQTEPMAMAGPDGKKIVVFTQWEHQDTVNRFALWKMQVDGSDNFTIFGEESSTDKSAKSLFQPRPVRSGPYEGYLLMGQNARTNHPFAAEGHVLMTKRAHFDLRSEKIFLQKMQNLGGVDQSISRTPEHYNDQSFAYAYRESSDHTYKLYVKDYPVNPSDAMDTKPGALVLSSDFYHLVQPRSFYPPESEPVAPAEGEIGQSRVSFTNNHLGGNAGFLVQNLGGSDNGVQHQLNGMNTNDLRLQFFIPSHTFSHSHAIGLKVSPEMSIPASGLIAPESDGSIGVILKQGLYTWKVHKRFVHADTGQDIWIPIRAERQEVSFVPNRVNACNQCHQERNQANLDRYAKYESIAAKKMQGNLSNVIGTNHDISTYNAKAAVPSFHRDVIPLLAKPSVTGGPSCMACHGPKDKLNLSNATGVDAMNATYRNLVAGAHVLSDATGVAPFVRQTINPIAMDDHYGPAPFLWGLLLNDDLAVPPDAGHPNHASRNLDRAGDYGAAYNKTIEDDIAAINAQYNHSRHWSAADIQAFITYSTTQSAVGLSDRIPNDFTANLTSRTTDAAQKAYQAMVRNCFVCHTDNLTDGINDKGFGLPLIKRFIDPIWLSDPATRFVMKSHVEDNTASSSTRYSPYPWISNLAVSMDSTLASASHRIDFKNPDDSELLVYARGGLGANGSVGNLNDNVSPNHPALPPASNDYIHLANWVKGIAGTPNRAPTLALPATPIVIKEYDDPAYLANPITWSDPDDDGTGTFELSQALIKQSEAATHAFNDTMLALDYQGFTSARLQTYAILGDRGNREFELVVTDGLSGTTQKIPVTVTSDYVVPRPVTTLPNATAFYTVRSTGELRKLKTNGDDVSIGVIPNYNGATWTTVYRRADKGWLYFVEQMTQKIHVVDETNANHLFSIKLDHAPNKDAEHHKQTVYLIWWRPAEKTPGDPDYRPGELQGLLESKLSTNKNGDFYVGLGDGELPPPLLSVKEMTVIPQYRTKLTDGGNTVAVYVWKRATFMSKWNNTPTDANGMDRLNVLNLVTGKAKPLAPYSFAEKTVEGVSYPARDYFNVRAIVVAEDGAFYGFNKDINTEVEVFNFDPIEAIQQPAKNIPSWIGNLMNDPVTYATPFVVIDPRP